MLYLLNINGSLKTPASYHTKCHYLVNQFQTRPLQHNLHKLLYSISLSIAAANLNILKLAKQCLDHYTLIFEKLTCLSQLSDSYPSAITQAYLKRMPPIRPIKSFHAVTSQADLELAANDWINKMVNTDHM